MIHWFSCFIVVSINDKDTLEIMAFGQKIKQIRLEKGFSQEQVAKEMGYPTNTYVSDVERGRFVPQPDKLEKLARALGMTYEEIEDLLLESKLQDLGLDDPGFTLMFKEVPNMTREEKHSLIRAYEAVIKARKPERKKRSS